MISGLKHSSLLRNLNYGEYSPLTESLHPPRLDLLCYRYPITTLDWSVGA